MHGKTGVYIFEDSIDADGYVNILEQALLPLLRDIYRDGYLFIQNNDQKHASKRTLAFLCQKVVNWFKTPPESPYLSIYIQ